MMIRSHFLVARYIQEEGSYLQRRDLESEGHRIGRSAQGVAGGGDERARDGKSRR